jgi:uncharacterized repeat protein (TIGR03803 family)
MHQIRLSFVTRPICRCHAIRILALFLVFATTIIASSAQTFTPILSFDGTDGSDSISGMAQGRDGDLYGTTQQGGSHSAGTVYRIATNGHLVTLHNFCSATSCTDGSNPSAALVLGTDGNFYGTTFGDGNITNCGAPGCGTVFKITPAGKLTTLHNFCSVSNCQDGANPYAGLVEGADENFYGTTSAFGTGSLGTIFKITRGGQLTTLYTFGGMDGASPYGQLIQATDGNFYGTTSAGGTAGDGTIFRMTSAGSLTTLHNFSGKDGSTPYAGLFQSLQGIIHKPLGDFWGTTSSGGVNGEGTLFTISFSGKLDTLYNFCQEKDCADGAAPYAGVVMDNTGAVWGVTSGGGSADLGMLFYTTDGHILVLVHSFCTTASCADGLQPQAAMVQHTGGTLYSTTPNGAAGFGAIFSVANHQPAFIEALPGSGKVGATVGILGSNLSGATKVKFGSVSANFKIVSATFITATVPTGASSAFLTVVTPSKSFRSNQKFLVKP